MKQGYKSETILHYVNRMHATIALIAENLDVYHVVISKGNKKVGHVFNVSTAPVLTCDGVCAECSKFCYDIKACLAYPSVMRARAINTAILWYDPDRYWTEIDSFLSRYHGKYRNFRYHVGGEVRDLEYFDRMMYSAMSHSDWTMWTYTKRYDTAYRWQRMNHQPVNFAVMYSEWRGRSMFNPLHKPEFRVLFDGEEAPAGAYICPGNCEKCLHDHRGCVAGETVYARIH